MSALPAAGITIIIYCKIPKVQIHDEISNLREKYFSMLLCETKSLFHRKENEFDLLILFSRVAGPAVRRDLTICHFMKDNSIVNKSNPGVRILHAYQCYKFHELLI